MTGIITMVDVSKTFSGGKAALEGITLSIEEGSFVYLLGPSGAGKSTFLSLLAGVEKPTRGQIIVGGRNLPRLGRKRLSEFRREIGFIFQDFRLIPEKTAIENVALALMVSGVSMKRAEREADEILDRVGLPGEARTLPSRALSGGEKQRTALARAIIVEPEILLADEPTGNLDPEISKEVFRIIEEENRAGTTVVVATHDTGRASDSDHPVIYLKEGRIAALRGVEGETS